MLTSVYNKCKIKWCVTITITKDVWDQVFVKCLTISLIAYIYEGGHALSQSKYSKKCLNNILK